MIVLHAGFDGLDLALMGTAPPHLIQKLEIAKQSALDQQRDIPITVSGVEVQVGPSGRRGGYSCTFSTGRTGAIWAVKRPRPGDPWGVYVSARSRALALLGLEAVRADISETAARLGFKVPDHGVSLGRVDFAVDLLAPDFRLDPMAFVTHPRTTRKTHGDLTETATNGRSGSVTSVTVGKMPGRQVIVYDKTDEALTRGKSEWPLLWNAALARMSLPERDFTDRKANRVWRVEYRLGKAGLRARHDIRRWSAFYDLVQGEFDQLALDASLRAPTGDSNRSRWPEHPLWALARQTLAERLFAHDVTVPPEAVRAIDLAEKQAEFLRGLTGSAVTLAYLEGVTPDRLPDFAAALPDRMQTFLDSHPRKLPQRMREAEEKYGQLVGGGASQTGSRRRGS